MTEVDRKDRSSLLLYGAFTASGVAGLIYELVWTRYLALFLGHSAYAQVLVIAVYLSGLAAGALYVGDRSETLARPLLRYAAVEAGLAVAGLLFHPVFRLVTDAAYGFIFSGLSAALLGGLKWAIAVVLILPQATLLGATFPLMTAGVIRRTGRGGRTVALLYFVNTLGGAAGVLLAGFALVGWLTLPGTLAAAAVLNGLAAAIVWRVARREVVEPVGAAVEGSPPEVVAEVGEGVPVPPDGAREASDGAAYPWTGPFSRDRLWGILLAVTFGTALASFIYEIGWIRMLSLVLASATHSFEIMLSAFLLGLAAGALLIRRQADGSARPVRLLGWIQWLMGLAALATLPVYARSFHTMSWLFHVVPHTAAGYPWFNLGRYGLALAVMLPATVLAGMTLPLITGTLLRAGTGERAIGWVYGVNTLGSVLGVALAELILMPWLGVQTMLAAGAALDMALGIGLLAHGSPGQGALRRWLPASAATLVTALAVAGAVGLPLSKVVLSSGVFRVGAVPAPASRTVLYYADGRTATVAAYVYHDDGRIVLATNGKPDASLSQRWLLPAREEGSEPTWNPDEPTQIFTGLLPLAFRPDARTAVVIGQGSGVTTHFLLGSPRLQHMTTVEIEPDMIQASRQFYPANRRAFDDPRSEFVIDDARSFFAGRHRRYDIITSEPSNPWVSGTADLFTTEFYHRIRQYLTDGGVFVQWLQLYEMSDDLVLDILAAVHRAFPDYRAYMIANADMLIVAGNGPLPEPDWSVVSLPDVARDLAPLPAFTPDLLNSLFLFDRSSMAPLLDGRRRVNSDFDPVVDLGADRARFLDVGAAGIAGLVDHSFDIVRALEGRRLGFGAYTLPPVGDLPAMFNRARSNWIHAKMRGQAVAAPPRTFGRAWADYASLAGDLPHLGPPADWNAWTEVLAAAAGALQSGTAGVPDTLFWDAVTRYVDRENAPQNVREAVDFLYGAAAWDFQRVRRVAPDLIAAVQAGHTPLDPGEIMDVACVSYLKGDAPDQALDVLRRLAPLTGRQADDVRTQLLKAYAVQVAGSR